MTFTGDVLAICPRTGLIASIKRKCFIKALSYVLADINKMSELDVIPEFTNTPSVLIN